MTNRLREFKAKYDSELFWFELLSKFRLFDSKRFEMLPPELHGVRQIDAVLYMRENFPYPILRYISPFLLKLQKLFPDNYRLATTDSDLDNISEINFTPTFLNADKKEAIVIFSNLDALLRHYEAVRIWFGKVMKLPYFRIRLAPDPETGPQIQFLLCSYTPLDFLLMLRGGSTYFIEDFWAVFNKFNKFFLGHGEFSAKFLNKLTRPTLRQAFIDYGVRDEIDISLVHRQFKAYPVIYEILQSVWRTEQNAKGLIEDAIYSAKLRMGSGKPLSILSRLFLQLQKINCLENLSGLLNIVNPPQIFHLKKAFTWVYNWLVAMLGICPLVFMQCLVTVIFQKSNRHRFILLSGAPKTGKTLLTSVLLDLFHAKNFDEFSDENFTREIAYTKGLELFIVDDASAPTLGTLQNHRGVFDKKVRLYPFVKCYFTHGYNPTIFS